jgi:putative thiamine transport system permease protein
MRRVGGALAVAPAVTYLVLALPVAFGLGATVLPAFGFMPALGGHSFSPEPFRMLLAEPGLLRSCMVSLASGLLSAGAALAVVAGFLAAWANTRVFRALQHMLSPLLSVPHAAAAFGIVFLFAPSGWLMRLVSPELTGMQAPPDWLIIHDTLGLSMTAGLFAKELPFLFLIALAAMPQVRPRQWMQVSRSLGYGSIAGFLYGVWPQLYPQMRLAVFAVIAYATSVVDVAIILGPTSPAPLAVRLVGWMNDPDLAMRFKASAGAVLQLGVTALALALWIAGERIAGAVLKRLRKSGTRFRREKAARLLLATMVGLAAATVLAGLFLLALWSFAGSWNFPDAFPSTLTLANWERQADAAGRPLAITLAVALVATACAVFLALSRLESEARSGHSRHGRGLLILYLPLLVPQASFVFGLQLFFLSIGLDGSFAALVAVHLVFVLPYVLLSLSDPWRAFDRRYVCVAQAMGSSDAGIFWRIRLPMLIRPVLTAAAVGFAVSVGQYLPTVLVGAGRWPTLATEAVALSSGGDRRVIGVYAFLQLALPAIGFLAATMIPAFLHARRRDMRAAT